MNNEFIYSDADIATMGIFHYFIEPAGQKWMGVKYIYYNGIDLIWINYSNDQINVVRENAERIIGEWSENNRVMEVDRYTAINKPYKY